MHLVMEFMGMFVAAENSRSLITADPHCTLMQGQGPSPHTILVGLAEKYSSGSAMWRIDKNP